MNAPGYLLKPWPFFVFIYLQRQPWWNDISYFSKGIIPSGNLPRVYSQVATSLMYYFQSGNFSSLSFPQSSAPSSVITAVFSPLLCPSRSVQPPSRRAWLTFQPITAKKVAFGKIPIKPINGMLIRNMYSQLSKWCYCQIFSNNVENKVIFLV